MVMRARWVGGVVERVRRRRVGFGGGRRERGRRDVRKDIFFLFGR